MQEILELPDISKDIKNDYFEFQIVVVWFQNNVKLYKMSIMVNNFKAIKDTPPLY
jgi:hypothetical protein